MSARDADTGRNADLMYFFTSDQHSFELDPFTGEIRSKAVFDREQNPKYSLTVQVEDSIGLLFVLSCHDCCSNPASSRWQPFCRHYLLRCIQNSN